MRRLFVTTCALALALAPAALFAQTQPPTQPPAQQTPPAQPEPPKEIRLSFTGDAGVLLYQIKPDQTAVFEELVAKIKTGLTSSEDPIRKQQAASLKVYKSNEPMGANALYVMVIDPAVKAAEYDLFVLLAEIMGKEYGSEVNQEFAKRAANAFAAGVNRLNLTPLASGGM